MFQMNSENGENCDFAGKEKEIQFVIHIVACGLSIPF